MIFALVDNAFAISTICCWATLREPISALLTVPYNHCQEAVNALCSQFRQHYGSDKFKYVMTMIVKHEQLLDVTTDLTYIHKQIHDYLQPMHLHIIYSEKRDCHIVYHIYGTLEPARSTLLLIAERLSQLFHEIGKYYIAIGNTVEGIQMVYHSYETAVILLQSSYFFEPGYVLSTELIQAHKTVEASVLSEISEQYTLRVMDKERTEAFAALDQLYSICLHATGLLPNQVKSCYYEMFSSLYKVRKQNQLLPDFSIENHENIMDIMQSCFSYEILHQLLKEKTAVFFDDLSQLKPENATIYMIRDYINNNYMNANLSVKDIGDYVNLSVSYLCTFFKNSTGVTLNQYITEFRVERAKQLLADSRYRITDISSAVGYSDGNYFSKSFRKYTGLSPSEFREKALR